MGIFALSHLKFLLLQILASILGSELCSVLLQAQIN